MYLKRLLLISALFISSTAFADGIDSFTKTILHMDTDFSDSANTPLTWTARNSAAVSAAQSKFGGGSGLFTRASSHYIDTPDDAVFTLGSSDFSFDCWFRINGNQATFRHITGQNDSSFTLGTVAFNVFINTSNQLQGRCFSGSTQYNVTGTTALSVDTWYHCAFVRNGNNLNLYLDGTAEGGTTDVTGITFNNSANKVSIGRTGELDSNYFDGYIDEFRFSNTARWTSNFTPETSAYSVPAAGGPVVTPGPTTITGGGNSNLVIKSGGNSDFKVRPSV